jgi:hypothetical protein
VQLRWRNRGESGDDPLPLKSDEVKRINEMRLLLLALALPLAACTSKTTPPDAPKPPHVIGMANPASVYCLNKGGEQVPVQSPQGVRTECKLPGGEVIDEWALFRRDHPQPAR